MQKRPSTRGPACLQAQAGLSRNGRPSAAPGLAGSNHLFTVNSWAAATAVLTVCYVGWSWRRNGRFACCLSPTTWSLLDFGKPKLKGGGRPFLPISQPNKSTIQNKGKRPSTEAIHQAQPSPANGRFAGLVVCQAGEIQLAQKRPSAEGVKRPFLCLVRSDRFAAGHVGKRPFRPLSVTRHLRLLNFGKSKLKEGYTAVYRVSSWSGG